MNVLNLIPERHNFPSTSEGKQALRESVAKACRTRRVLVALAVQTMAILVIGFHGRLASFWAPLAAWLVTSAAGVLYFWAFRMVVTGIRHTMRAKLREIRICASCGYDLRGNVSGMCPECGETVGPGVWNGDAAAY